MADPWAEFRVQPAASADPWAEFRVGSSQRAQAERQIAAEPDLGPKPLAFGIPVIGPYLEEAGAAVAAIPNAVTGGMVGPTYEQSLERMRARNRRAERDYPVVDTVGQVAAGIATGGPVFSRLAPAATAAGRVGQGMLVGGTVGAIEGFGKGEGNVSDRVGTAAEGAAVGTALGAALPVAANAVTRAYGAAVDNINPTITRMRYGPEAAADQILANRMARAGTSPAEVRLDLQRGQTQAGRMGANSYADVPETIADTSDAMQRLTGSVYRAGGEAGNFVRQTLEGRQRGPANPYAPQPGEPTGQRARIMDATERALQIRTAGTALQNERQIVQAQAQQGRQLYAQAFQQQQPFDIQPVLDGFALNAMQYPAPFQAQLQRALNLFRNNSPTRFNPNGNLLAFDNAKKALDDMIERAQRAGSGNLVRELTTFRNDLLGAVHANGANTPYQAARAAWGTAAENREAIDLGRAALRDGSEISAEQYRNLTTGQQQLFRIGFLESLRNAMGTRRPGNDVTQLFQQARVQELMNEIIPTRGRGVMRDLPERYGDLMRREARMVQTRNAVLGNSATAQRQQDDMGFAGDALQSMWNRFRQSPSLFNMGVEAVGSGIQRVFGYRQDVALQLAQRLLEADPTRRNQILQRLRARGGPDRFARFAEGIDRSSISLVGGMASPLQLDDQRGGTR